MWKELLKWVGKALLSAAADKAIEKVKTKGEK